MKQFWVLVKVNIKAPLFLSHSAEIWHWVNFVALISDLNKKSSMSTIWTKKAISYQTCQYFDQALLNKSVTNAFGNCWLSIISNDALYTFQHNKVKMESGFPIKFCGTKQIGMKLSFFKFF